MECQLDDITVHYEMFGDGRPIVVLHGSPADHLSAMRIMEPIFKLRRGWKRIYPDLPGMGKTPGMDWIKGEDDVLDIVLNFIGRVVPDQTVTLAGYSYGGYLAQGVVYRKPALVNGLFLLAPATGLDEAERSLPPQVTLIEDETLLEELAPDEIPIFQMMAVVQNRQTLDEFQDYLRRAADLADHEFLSRKRDKFSFDVRVLPNLFFQPVLMVTGRQDSITGYRDVWDVLENYPRATFAVLDRAGHPLPFEQETLLRAMVNEWLDRVEEATAL